MEAAGGSGVSTEPLTPTELTPEEVDARALRTVVGSIDPSQRIYVSIGTLRWLFAAVREPVAPDFMAADRALAVEHREDDQPCGCDECMSYGAEDEGFDWYKVSPARRIVLRVLDSGDDRLAPIATAFREHERESEQEQDDLDATAPGNFV